MKLTITTLLLCFIVGCSQDPYSQAPKDMIDEAKPFFLCNKFMAEANYEGLRSTLSANSLKTLNKQIKENVNYLDNIRMRDYDHLVKKYKYYTVDTWTDKVGIEKAKGDIEHQKKLPSNQKLLIIEDPDGSGHGGTIVVLENGLWKVNTEFRPIK